MGWTFYHVPEWFDRKAEIDEKYNWSEDGVSVRVLKSAMVGSTYYAAVQVEDKDGVRVEASVVLTSMKSRDYFNFGYKAMSETVGPGESKCPAGILKMLTPTDSEWANQWRGRCWKYHEQKKSPNALGKLPYGAEIEFSWCGKPVRIVKRRPAYQFKSDWWQICGENQYFSKKRIPSKYEVVAGKEAA